jgi:hypothetical protein
MKNRLKIVALWIVFLLHSCGQKKEVETDTTTKTEIKPVVKRIKTKKKQFAFQNTKEWLSKWGDNQAAKNIILAVNRVDESNLIKTDSIITPTDYSGSLEYYMPFPLEVKTLNKVKKIILFSYATQAFAAYEYGTLTHVGPTSLGKEIYKTPTGLFFTNWKAKETISTFNDEWKLKWNFNIANKLGIGFHQYELPGYPASHSCLRLLEKDAKMLYEFADQWVLQNAQAVAKKGTPVIVFGSYNFQGPKPWFALTKDATALNISEDHLAQIIKPLLPEILKEQQNSAVSPNKVIK